MEEQFGKDWPAVVFSYDSQARQAVPWIQEGAWHEDDGFNTQHHFYKINPPGPLVDYAEVPFGFLPANRVDSFKRASDQSSNSESWKRARQYQFEALQSASKAARDASFGHMFKALGHVLHLNQDLAQPSHTRNDNHFRKRFIEPYGSEVYWKGSLTPPYAGFPLSQRTWAQWRAAGFAKLEDFWNRYLYLGQAQALIDNEDPNKPMEQLGLAEYSNGNFLSEDALYRELYRQGDFRDPHYFEFPSIYSSTSFQDVRQNLQIGAAYDTFRNGVSGQRIFLKKTGDGVEVQRHSVLTYLGVKRLNTGNIAKWGVSIDSPGVLQDYHSILIPKAIEYSAGILDYFFRGRLEIHYGWNGAQYRLRITNRSGQPFQGGEFKLFRDDAAGVRTEVLTLVNSGTLSDGQTVETTFSEPQAYPSTHVLVYKGTIGAEGGVPLDPVDANIGIIARRFVLDPTTSAIPSYTEAGDYPVVRIKDFDPQKFATACGACAINPSLLTWDGTFPSRGDSYDPPFGAPHWSHANYFDASPSRKLNNYAMISTFVQFAGNGGLEESRYGYGYYMEISCFSESEGLQRLWVGRKIDGRTVTGIYRPILSLVGGFCIPLDAPIEIEIEPAP